MSDADREFEFEFDVDLAVELLRSQFPKWADLPIEAVRSSGTVNSLFRLGEDMVIRLPHRVSNARFIEKEHRWLPIMAPNFSLSVPTPLAMGKPQDAFPWPWSIYSWLEGQDGWTEPIEDLPQAAADVAQFIVELRAIDPSEGPRAGQHNSFRGLPLANLDSQVRKAIDELGDRIDTQLVTEAWELALAQPRWTEDRWIHGDLQPGNLLSQRGSLTAVIDFGLMGVGDPAADLLPAWNLLTADTRGAFRDALEVDDATWIRGHGWALFQALLALPYYWDNNPVMVQMSQRVLRELFTD